MVRLDCVRRPMKTVKLPLTMCSLAHTYIIGLRIIFGREKEAKGHRKISNIWMVFNVSRTPRTPQAIPHICGQTHRYNGCALCNRAANVNAHYVSNIGRITMLLPLSNKQSFFHKMMALAAWTYDFAKSISNHASWALVRKVVEVRLLSLG